MGRGSSEFKPPGRIFNGNFQLRFLLSFGLELLRLIPQHFFLFSIVQEVVVVVNIGQPNAHKKQGGWGDFLVFIAMGGDSIIWFDNDDGSPFFYFKKSYFHLLPLNSFLFPVIYYGMWIVDDVFIRIGTSIFLFTCLLAQLSIFD